MRSKVICKGSKMSKVKGYKVGERRVYGIQTPEAVVGGDEKMEDMTKGLSDQLGGVQIKAQDS